MEKTLLVDILKRHSLTTLDRSFRLTKEQLEERDDYFLIRTIKKNQKKVLTLAKEELDLLIQIMELKEKMDTPENDCYHSNMNKVRRLEEQVAEKSLQFTETAYEGVDAVHIILARDKKELLEASVDSCWWPRH